MGLKTGLHYAMTIPADNDQVGGDLNVATKELSREFDQTVHIFERAPLSKIWQFFRLLD